MLEKFKTLGIYLPASIDPSIKKEILTKAMSSNIDNIWLSDKYANETAFNEIIKQSQHYPNLFWWTGIISSLQYSLKELTELTWNVSKQSNESIGLGLSVGDIGKLKSQYPNLSIGKAIDKLDKMLTEFPIYWNKMQKNSEDKVIPLPKIAVGALGDKMITLAADKADYLFLNSSRLTDIERAQRIVGFRKSSCKLIPLILLEPYPKKDLFVWYLVKKMLKYSSKNVLRSYGYDNSLITEIKNLTDDYPKNLPSIKEPELKKVFYETIVTGNETDIMTKIRNIQKMDVDGIVIRVSLTNPEAESIFWKNYLPKIQNLIKI